MEPSFWKAPNNLSPWTVPLICSVCYFPPSLLLSVQFPMLCSGRCGQKSHVLSLSITALNSKGRDSGSPWVRCPLWTNQLWGEVCVCYYENMAAITTGEKAGGTVSRKLGSGGDGGWGGGCQSNTQINQAVMHGEVPTSNLLWIWRPFLSKR